MQVNVKLQIFFIYQVFILSVIIECGSILRCVAFESLDKIKLLYGIRLY